MPGMDHWPEYVQCRAKSKQGKRRCKRPAIPGGYVCVMHGGKAPQVKKAAQARLEALVHPALDVLAEQLYDDDKNRDKHLQVKVSGMVLDRTGLHGKQGIVEETDSGGIDVDKCTPKQLKQLEAIIKSQNK